MLDPYDGEAAEVMSNASEANTKRGRHRIPECWTKVVSISCDNLQNIRGHNIATDLLVNEGVEPPKRRKNAKQWQPIFMSKAFVEDHQTDAVEDYRLQVKDL